MMTQFFGLDGRSGRRLALFAVIALISAPAPAAVVSGITTDNPNSADPGRAVTSANLTSITTGGQTHAAPWLVPVSTSASATTVGKYWAINDPEVASVNAAFEDLDITTGQANTVDTVLFFQTPFTDLNGAVPNVAILEISTGSVSESWTVEAIVGGTPASPVYGGTALTFAQNGAGRFGDTGHQVGVQRSETETLNQDIYGVGIDFAELGLAPTDTLAGVRVVSSSGDPSLIVGIIPEPGSAALVAGMAMLPLLRRRRRV